MAVTAADLLTGAEIPYQDHIDLGPGRSPGLATIVGSGLSPRNWDVRQGYGLSGAWVVYTGDGLAKFAVQIELWLPEHFLAWKVFSKLCLERPLPGMKPKAQDIKHPLLNMSPFNISSVVVEDVEAFSQDEFGMWTTKISFLQFRAPRPALGKPLASIPSASKPTPTAQDAADLEIQALQAQFGALAK